MNEDVLMHISSVNCFVVPLFKNREKMSLLPPAWPPGLGMSRVIGLFTRRGIAG